MNRVQVVYVLSSMAGHGCGHRIVSRWTGRKHKSGYSLLLDVSSILGPNLPRSPPPHNIIILGVDDNGAQLDYTAYDPSVTEDDAGHIERNSL